MIETALNSYEMVASEYYDSSRHPTCANFREASAFLLKSWIPSNLKSKWICEVGVGKSLLAEILDEKGSNLDHLILLDSSPLMLNYSRSWKDRGASLVLGDAFALPVMSESLNLLVSSLGDPFNEPYYWKEVHRVLQAEGISLFTTPSYAWASSFRTPDYSKMMLAEFEISESQNVQVPSFIYPVNEQVALIERSGLSVTKVIEFPIGLLKNKHLSPKLNIERGPDASIITGYFIVK